MSIIGPRPHMLFHTEAYSEIVADYMNRLHVKPGITGLSQVMGYRGEIKNKMMIANRVRLDIFYIKKWSVGLDIKIVFKTIRLIVLGD
jgi:putative colanic acid biosynthesis UDP-glucose lipid carrier transferase